MLTHNAFFEKISIEIFCLNQLFIGSLLPCSMNFVDIDILIIFKKDSRMRHIAVYAKFVQKSSDI